MADQHDLAAAPEWISASICTLVTSGQVASRKNMLRACAAAGTDLGTPWAEKITGCVAFGNLVQLLDEHRALGAQSFDDVSVVDDLVAHIDRRAEFLERQLDDLDGAVDPGAKAARRAHHDSEGWQVGGHGPTKGLSRRDVKKTAMRRLT